MTQNFHFLSTCCSIDGFCNFTTQLILNFYSPNIFFQENICAEISRDFHIFAAEWNLSFTMIFPLSAQSPVSYHLNKIEQKHNEFRFWVFQLNDTIICFVHPNSASKKTNQKEASLYLMRRKSADKDEVHNDDAAIGNFLKRWWEADKAFVKTFLLLLSYLYLILSFLILSYLIWSYLILYYLLLSYIILSHWQFPPEMMGGWQSFCEDFLIGPQSGSQTESTML